jgi:hypothetical protein
MNNVDVLRQAGRSMGRCGKPADDDKLDPGIGQYRDQFLEVGHLGDLNAPPALRAS